jgi:hypothetical protein
MRRILVLSLALGTVLVGCSSSDDAKTAASTTTSSVVISAENKQACEDLDAFQELLLDGVTKTGSGSQEEQATALKGLYASLIPPLEKAKASVPEELQEAVQQQIEANAATADLDPTSAEDQRALISMAVFPTGDVKSSSEELTAWGKANCGIAFGK